MAKKGVVEGATENGFRQAGGSRGPFRWALSHLIGTSQG